MLIIADFAHKNYQFESLFRHNKVEYLFDKSFPRGSIKQCLVSKTKTSELSRSLGEITTGKYLSEEHASLVSKRLKEIDTNSYDKVICMGSVSVKMYTGFGMKKAVGRTHLDKFYCTWHPDQMFSSEHIRKDLLRHLKDITSSETKTVSRKIKTNIVSEQKLLSAIEEDNPTLISFDIETSKYRIVDMISICWKQILDKNMAYVVKNPSGKFCKSIMKDRTCVSHKGTYDIPFLNDQCGLDNTPYKWYDTSYKARLSEPDERFALHETQKRHASEFPQWKDK